MRTFTFIKSVGVLALGCLLATGCGQKQSKQTAAAEPVPGKDGNKYVPYEKRTGEESVVYFTRKLSAEGLIEAYERVNAGIEGKVG